VNELLKSNFPFLTCIRCNEIEIVGIIINQNDSVLSIYDFGAIHNDAEKQQLLELGDQWWWESNRKIPINIFLKQEFSQFKPWLKTFARKEVTVVEGPTVSMLDLINRKIKRRTIQLVKTGN